MFSFNFKVTNKFKKLRYSVKCINKFPQEVKVYNTYFILSFRPSLLAAAPGRQSMKCLPLKQRQLLFRILFLTQITIFG